MEKDINEFHDKLTEGYNKVVPKHLREENPIIDEEKEKAFSKWAQKLHDEFKKDIEKLNEEIYSEEFLIEKLKEYSKNEGFFKTCLSEDNKTIPNGMFLTTHKYPLPNTIVRTAGLKLSGYKHPLPNSIVETKHLDLRNYEHPLPNSIIETGFLLLENYKHPLPNSIIKCSDKISAVGYKHKLPESIFNDENINKGFKIVL